MPQGLADNLGLCPAQQHEAGNGKEIAKPEREDALEKCVLACALCNMAKSNMFTYDKFKKVGQVIEELWRESKMSGLKVKVTN